MNATTQVHISISGATAAEVLAHARALGGETATSAISNDDLLAELRDRFSKMSPPMVVRVVPFSDDKSATTTGEAGGATRQPTAAEKKAAAKALADEAAKLKASKEPNKTTVAGAQAGAETGSDWDDGTADEGATDDTVPTQDDVKTALNACSAKNGQAATRELMKVHGGSMKLLDIKPENYRALIDALEAA